MSHLTREEEAEEFVRLLSVAMKVEHDLVRAARVALDIHDQHRRNPGAGIAAASRKHRELARVPSGLAERAEKHRASAEEIAALYGTTLDAAAQRTRDERRLRVRYSIARELLGLGVTTREAAVLLKLRPDGSSLVQGIAAHAPVLGVMDGGLARKGARP